MMHLSLSATIVCRPFARYHSLVSVLGRINNISLLSCVPVFGQNAVYLCVCLQTERNSVVSLSLDRTELRFVNVFRQNATQFCPCIRTERNSDVSLPSDRTQHSCVSVCRQNATGNIIGCFPFLEKR